MHISSLSKTCLKKWHKKYVLLHGMQSVVFVPDSGILKITELFGKKLIVPSM